MGDGDWDDGGMGYDDVLSFFRKALNPPEDWQEFNRSLMDDD